MYRSEDNTQPPAAGLPQPDRSRRPVQRTPTHLATGTGSGGRSPLGDRGDLPDRPKAELVWINTRSAITTAGIDTSPWPCWPTPSSPSPAPTPAHERGLPNSRGTEPLTVPEVRHPQAEQRPGDSLNQLCGKNPVRRKPVTIRTSTAFPISIAACEGGLVAPVEGRYAG
jgi:hypothetical protein